MTFVGWWFAILDFWFEEFPGFESVGSCRCKAFGVVRGVRFQVHVFKLLLGTSRMSLDTGE